jgi:hypothetical protein
LTAYTPYPLPLFFETKKKSAKGRKNKFPNENIQISAHIKIKDRQEEKIKRPTGTPKRKQKRRLTNTIQRKLTKPHKQAIITFSLLKLSIKK